WSFVYCGYATLATRTMGNKNGNVFCYRLGQPGGDEFLVPTRVYPRTTDSPRGSSPSRLCGSTRVPFSVRRASPWHQAAPAHHASTTTGYLCNRLAPTGCGR